jgi:hypothetical protein
MKLAWGFWFFCIGLFLSIPIQIAASAVWNLTTRLYLICNSVGGGTYYCSVPDFIKDTGFLILLKLMLASFFYGLINIGIALTVSLFGLFLMRKNKLW